MVVRFKSRSAEKLETIAYQYGASIDPEENEQKEKNCSIKFCIGQEKA